MANPTERHLAQAERHQEMAADHRAAADSLRKTEAAACAGLDVQTSKQGPFARSKDVTSTEMLPKGALLELRARKDLDEASLAKSVQCHLAQSASLGHEIPAMTHCPLALRDVTAEVLATDGMLAVAVESDDPKVVREIRRRANGLVAAPGATPPPPVPTSERR